MLLNTTPTRLVAAAAIVAWTSFAGISAQEQDVVIIDLGLFTDGITGKNWEGDLKARIATDRASDFHKEARLNQTGVNSTTDTFNMLTTNTATFSAIPFTAEGDNLADVEVWSLNSGLLRAKNDLDYQTKAEVQLASPQANGEYTTQPEVMQSIPNEDNPNGITVTLKTSGTLKIEVREDVADSTEQIRASSQTVAAGVEVTATGGGPMACSRWRVRPARR